MFFCFENIRTGFFWTCQFVFWLAAGLAVLNRFCVGVGVEGYLVAGLFGCFVSVIFILLHLSGSNTGLLNFAGQNWLAAAILGTLFQVNGFVIFVLIIASTEIIWWFLLREIITPESLFVTKGLPQKSHVEKTDKKDIADAEKIIEINDDEESDESPESDWTDNKTQQITRSKTESGGEKLEGYFLVEFGNDQLTASVHVPFYPVFDKLPEVEAYLVDAVEAKLTVAKVQRFGARIDVKRANNSVNNLRLVVVVWELI
ncbi:MAG: hypothetical protein LBL39_04180 [Planctomycetaceae bacterium]|jgi:hypothetical protein|nr:hypothetical protein [Planctomycetaceae bacterium]